MVAWILGFFLLICIVSHARSFIHAGKHYSWSCEAFYSCRTQSCNVAACPGADYRIDCGQLGSSRMNGLGFRSMAATNCKNRIPSGVRDRFLRAVGAKESDVATPTGTSDAMHITHGERLVLVKDNICDENIDMRCSSVVLDGYRSSATALALARLRDDAEAPYAVLSEPRANMDEFAMGSLTQNSIYGPTRNPWDTSRSAGGSSGGCAAAVASGQVCAALGSDTGGSVRLPASWCGCVGLRPSRGRIPRSGLASYASSMDTIGILGSSVERVARIFEIIQGDHGDDMMTRRVQKYSSKSFARRFHSVRSWRGGCLGGVWRGRTRELPMHGLRIGVARESFSALVNPSVRRAINNTVALMCSLGATVEEFNLFGNDASSEYPTCDEILASYYAIAAAEATSNLARYDGVRFGGNGLRKNSTNAPNNGEWMQEFMVYVRTLGFSDQVAERILLGANIIAMNKQPENELYSRALSVRRHVKKRFDSLLQERPSLLRRSSNYLFELLRRINTWAYRVKRHLPSPPIDLSLSGGPSEATPRSLYASRGVREGGLSAFDALLCPTAPDAAPKLRSEIDPLMNRSISSLFQEDIFTVFASLADLPALSIPVGFKSSPSSPRENFVSLYDEAADENEESTLLPIGVQLVAGRYQEALLLSVAAMLCDAMRIEGSQLAAV